MSLNFDWTNTDLSTESENDCNLAECLVWATMAVGINEITVANARDFYARVSLWEKVAGPYRYRIDPVTNQRIDYYITAEDVLRAVGLRTNASRMTPTQFNRHIWDTHNRFNVPRTIDTPAPVV